MNDTLELLNKIKSGELTPEQVLGQLKISPFEDLGYAKIDHHRKVRQGVSEVIYGQGKTKEQIEGILGSLIANGNSNILVTRVDKEKATYLIEKLDVTYHEIANICVANPVERPKTQGVIVVATGGTSDMSVAEEAAITAETLGNTVVRLYDVGVAGLHRLLTNLEPLMNARVVVAVAGMEGALASVLGGLVDCPVVAVPTSIGYGANFGGLSALLSMLNSCASGVSVVNIDNGFGAGYLASSINKIGEK